MKRFSIIGFPLEHSFSPEIHNDAFIANGIDATYSKIEIKPCDFAETIQSLKDEPGWNGFNVTIPFKQSIIPYVDSIESAAKKIGAVNTIRVEQDGTWIGYNTDYSGFLSPLKNYINNIRSCLIIGAGGAARAVAFGILQSAQIERLVIVNRTIQKARDLTDSLKIFYNTEYEVFSLQENISARQSFDLIVNTTSLGMGSLQNELPINPESLINKNTVVYDLIYNPAKTILLSLSEKVGASIINGLPMLIGQAEESFRIWTGKLFPDDLKQKWLKQIP